MPRGHCEAGCTGAPERFEILRYQSETSTVVFQNLTLLRYDTLSSGIGILQMRR